LEVITTLVLRELQAHQFNLGDEHYGDAMRDPEITFLVVPAEQGTNWTPLTFENSYMGCYQVVAEVTPDGRLKVRNAALLRDLRDFANQWDLNLMEQGFGKA
jgi:hypothetical protein